LIDCYSIPKAEVEEDGCRSGGQYSRRRCSQQQSGLRFFRALLDKKSACVRHTSSCACPHSEGPRQPWVAAPNQAWCPRVRRRRLR
jgi:hypothetical protein